MSADLIIPSLLKRNVSRNREEEKKRKKKGEKMNREGERERDLRWVPNGCHREQRLVIEKSFDDVYADRKSPTIQPRVYPRGVSNRRT